MAREAAAVMSKSKKGLMALVLKAADLSQKVKKAKGNVRVKMEKALQQGGDAQADLTAAVAAGSVPCMRAALCKAAEALGFMQSMEQAYDALA